MKIPIKALIFQLLIIEIIIGGGGRLFDFSGITLRMILFSFAILLSINDLFQGKTTRFDLGVLMTCLSLLTFFSLNGYHNQAKTTLIIEDLKPLAYYLILPFVSSRIKSISDLKFIINSIKWGGIFMSAAFIVLGLMLFWGFLNFDSLYRFMNSTNEFFFKGELSFFYKGFIFLPIAFIICLKEKKLVFASIILIAIILSLTRGLYILTILGVIFLYYNRKSLYLLCIPILIFFISSNMEKIIDLFTNINSDAYRFIQIREVINSVSIKSLLVGNGFGIGTETRPIHMEIAYLEILHKQGILGLLWVCFFLFIISANTFRSKINEIRLIGITGILIYMQSFFNSYILNPIGVSFLLINLIVFFKAQVHEN